MGNDGSGKSTIAKRLMKEFIRNGHSVEYLPGFNHIIIDYFLKCLPQKTISQKQQIFVKKDNKSLLFSFWPFLVYIDCIFLFCRCKIISRNRTILFDRYFYDYIPSYKYNGYDKFGILEVLFKLFPKPDKIVLLDVTPQVAHQRKKELGDLGDVDMEYFVNQRKTYLKLAKKLNIDVVNTDETIDQTLFNIKSLWGI